MPARQLIMMLLLLMVKKCASVRNHHQQTRTAVLFFFAPRLLSSLFGVQHNYLILDHPPPHTLLCSCTSVVVGGIMGETPSAPALLLNYNIALLVYKNNNNVKNSLLHYQTCVQRDLKSQLEYRLWLAADWGTGWCCIRVEESRWW